MTIMYGTDIPFDEHRSLRDWFAGLVFPSLIKEFGYEDHRADRVVTAQVAYRYAEAMLIARENHAGQVLSFSDAIDQVESGRGDTIYFQPDGSAYFVKGRGKG